jgi:gliding motility-associated-like protein
MTGGVGLFSGKGVTSSGMFSPAAAGAGTQVIRYTYTGPNGCVSVKEQAITVLAVPTVSAGPDKVVLEGGSVVLNGSATGNNLQYLWSPSSGLNNTSIIQPAASPTNDQTYSLTVTSIDGCAASDQVVVKVLKTPSVPNAFSPNGDGVHDKWEIQYLDSYPGATVDIFNRYGQKVFESKGYAKPWDGTVNGKSLPIGTYYYIIDPKNGRKAIAGFVDIIK